MTKKVESTANATSEGVKVNPVISALHTAYRMLCDLREDKRKAERIEPTDEEKKAHRAAVKRLTLTPQYEAFLRLATDAGVSVVLTYRTQTIGSRFYADLIKNALEFAQSTATMSVTLGTDLFPQVHAAEGDSVTLPSGATVSKELVPDSLETAQALIREFKTKDLRSSIKGS